MLSSFLNHHNHKFNGGTPNIPEAIGDRYYAQDFVRDFWYIMNLQGITLEALMRAESGILRGCTVKTTTGTNLQIEFGICFAPHAITIADAGWPPTPPNAIASSVAPQLFAINDTLTPLTVDLTTLTGVLNDSVSINYLKVAYVDADTANSRIKARAGGAYVYETTPGVIVTCNGAGANPAAGEVCLASLCVNPDFTPVLGTLALMQTATLEDKWDYIIDSNEKLTQLIATSQSNPNGNQTYPRILVKKGLWESNIIPAYTGTYLIDLTVIGCKVFQGEPGSVLRIQINDPSVKYCIGYNTRERITNSTYTSTYIRGVSLLIMNNNSAGQIHGFGNCTDLTDCLVNIYGDLNNLSTGYSFCDRLVNCIAEGAGKASGCYGFYSCTQLSGCMSMLLHGQSSYAFTGFHTCEDLVGCKAQGFLPSNLNMVLFGMHSCDNISGCNVDFTGYRVNSICGLHSCSKISATQVYIESSIAAETIGFNNCEMLASVESEIYNTNVAGIATAFKGCNYLSTCNGNAVASGGGVANDYLACTQVSGSIGKGKGGFDQFDLIIDSNEDLLLWRDSTALYSSVYIAKGTYTISTLDISGSMFFDLTTMGTTRIVAHPESLIICTIDDANSIQAIWRNSTSLTDVFSMSGVSIRVTNTNTTAGLYLTGFAQIWNMENCRCEINSYSTTGTVIAFDNCDKLLNCFAKTNALASSISLTCYSSCDYLNSCLAETAGAGGTVKGYYNCKTLVNCVAIINNTTVSIGFDSTTEMTNCKATCPTGTSGSGFTGCDRITNCEFSGAPVIIGFSSCDYICNCLCTTSGVGAFSGCFYTCTYLSGCKASANGFTSGAAYGVFEDCDNLTNCEAILTCSAAIQVQGFRACDEVTNCRATVSGGASPAHGFNLCSQLQGCWGNATGNATDGVGFYQCTGVVNCRGKGLATGVGLGYGFAQCKKMSQNKISDGASKTATYGASYADAGTANACADTAAGGYNS